MDRLDTHFHLQANPLGLHISSVVEEGRLEREKIFRDQINEALAFHNISYLFITPTYQFYTDKISDLISENRIISHALAAEERAFGLCGVPIQHVSAVEIARECLKLPGMKGIKIRMLQPTPDHLRHLAEIVSLANDANAIVLVHFSRLDYNTLSAETRHLGDKHATAAVIRIMKRYQNAKLIIAHSGVPGFIGLDGLIEIGRQRAALPNIYVDISGFIHEDIRFRNVPPSDLSSNQLMKDYFEIWRKFGIDHVLFGSDRFPGRKMSVLPFCDTIAESELTWDEKIKIISTNGIRIISREKRP